jgi:hypothetical protein
MPEDPEPFLLPDDVLRELKASGVFNPTDAPQRLQNAAEYLRKRAVKLTPDRHVILQKIVGRGRQYSVSTQGQTRGFARQRLMEGKHACVISLPYEPFGPRRHGWSLDCSWSSGTGVPQRERLSCRRAGRRKLQTGRKQ